MMKMIIIKDTSHMPPCPHDGLTSQHTGRDGMIMRTHSLIDAIERDMAIQTVMAIMVERMAVMVIIIIIMIIIIITATIDLSLRITTIIPCTTQPHLIAIAIVTMATNIHTPCPSKHRRLPCIPATGRNIDQHHHHYHLHRSHHHHHRPSLASHHVSSFSKQSIQLDAIDCLLSSFE